MNLNTIHLMKKTYIRFLSLVHVLDSTSAHMSNVDQTAKQLLNVIVLRHAQDKPLNVTDAMALSAIASPATIHRKLDDLRESGLIDQVFEGKDRRTKYLVPTPNADEYFAELGNLMQKAHLA
jgi:DNA-binding MarR family transcriptional regulator